MRVEQAKREIERKGVNRERERKKERKRSKKRKWKNEIEREQSGRSLYVREKCGSNLKRICF